MSDAPSSSPASHWCYHCNKRVVVETLDDLVVCCECNKGFVESIQPIPAAYSSPAPPQPLSPDLTVEDSSIGSHFLQMLRLLAHAPSQRSPPRHLDVLSYEDDFFRLELNSRTEIDEDEDEDDGDEEEEEDEEENLTVNDEEEEEDDLRRRNRFPLTTTRSRTGRNRILDWAEILMGIEDNSIEFRMESERYTGNPADYIDDAAGYEALLQNLAEGDGGGGGRRGAPPAAKSAIEALETFQVTSSEGETIMVCAVCKDGMVMGETGKKLPCGHCYHGDCIVPWLGTRNSCPVCRFQLQTDDAEYEEERKKRTSTLSDSATASSSSSASRH
ncbi:Zinc finger RING-type [Arabidopsis thaliana x Arabidopsis arenosa]|uniref:RING-type E3 ubiquitin transferase n=1 Tax=Arabidopsis thaliana x Arabidopsis arenosa TaxID=1240361 RepID=A0A8T1XSJ0_9BRAS|nr:Zinc finger RING-type [Arabidopsis thaliana x Arabidopsis arenosa]